MLKLHHARGPATWLVGAAVGCAAVERSPQSQASTKNDTLDIVLTSLRRLEEVSSQHVRV